MINIFLVFIGGAFGCCARYLSNEAMVHFVRERFFLATMTVNIVGSFLIGILDFLFIYKAQIFSPSMRLFMVVGFLGGFTTFSTFALDIFKLIDTNQAGSAIIYAVLSVNLSIIAVVFGFFLMKLLL